VTYGQVGDKWCTNHVGYLLDVWQGGFFLYSEEQLDAIKMALLNFQVKNDTKAAVLISMAHSSGPVSSIVTITQLIEINEVYSSWSASDSIMMRLILPKYTTNSWRSPLSLAMRRQVHSLTLFKVWVIWSRIRAFG
jgi:hypothetical protein